MVPLVPLQTGISPYNPLVVALVIVGIGALLGTVYLVREVRSDLDRRDRQSFAWLFGLLGGIGLLVSGELFWANWAGFPAQQYTELFGVALTLYAIVMLAAFFVLYTDLDPRPFAWVTAISGLVLLQGARAILDFQLTLEPLVAAGIWTAAGLAGILLLPTAYADAGSPTRRYLVYLVSILLVTLAVLSLFVALEAHYGHIADVA